MGQTGSGQVSTKPLGVWAPTFSACELAAAFLLPFVAIRVVAGDRQSGALKIEMQHSMSSFARIAAKILVLLVGWLIASLAPIVAVLLWKSYGGNVYLPEVATVAIGHALNASLTIALAAAAACLTEHPSTAAIVTLTVTVGSWIINFLAAVHGGLWERAAGYTPTAMVAQFQHGLVRLDVVVIAISLIAAGLSLAAVWMRLGVATFQRTYESIGVIAITGVLITLCMLVNASWDTSESRMNSFSRSDEQALRQIRTPLNIEAHLAPEDPRRFDLEHRAISKLRRSMSELHVAYVSSSSIGLFEQTNAHYGEISYDLGGRKAVNRITTPEGVLETIYSLAGIPPPSESGEDTFRGHPLAVRPKGAAVVFYIVWPLLIASVGVAVLRSHS